MRRFFRLFAVAALSVASLSQAAVAADDADASFRLLFGDKYAQAMASSQVTDDVALADEMVTAAKTVTQTPKLLTLLCDRAYLLGLKDPDGYDSAARAMQLLIEHVPDRAGEAHDKLIDVRQRSFARAKPDHRTAAGQALIDAITASADAKLGNGVSMDGATGPTTNGGGASAAIALYRRAGTIAAQIKSDSAADIKAKLDAALVAERHEKQVESLKSRVLENASDHASAEQLVRLFIIDLDRPAPAQKYVNHVKDADLKKHMLLAAKPLAELTEGDAQSLGVWYRTQSTQAKEPAAKAAMLARASGCFERFLEMHTADDLPRTTVKLAHEDVKKALVKLAEAGTTPVRAVAAPKVIRLFNGKDLTNWKAENIKQSNWSVAGAILDPGDPGRFRLARGADLVHNGQGSHLVTEQSFGDCVLELSFMTTRFCNSGVALMGEYEIQIWDPSNKKGGGRPEQQTGSIYGMFAPRVDAQRQPGQWQTLLIDFRAPRFDKNGNKTANARFNRVVLNGQLIHQDVEVKGGTGVGSGREAPTGPLLLAGQGSVAFKDITIKPVAEK